MALGRLSSEVFDAVIFDMDGTLIDSVPAVERSWGIWAAEYGLDVDTIRRFHGVPAAGIVEVLIPKDRQQIAIDRINELEVADVEGIVVLPGADGLLATLAAGGVPTAIVTSGTTDLAEARLEATGLTHPPVVVTASDVERGKPWPDPWLEGARRLGVDPADCLVVEDAVAGLRAARAAGCRALVAVLGTTAREELESEADVVVPDFTHLTTHVEGGRVSVGLA